MSNETRKLPTRPGWWLIGADPRDTSGGLPYEAVVVYQGRGGLLVSGRTPNRVDQNGGIVWLAPIPGPEVLAALAELVAELALYDDGASTFGRLDTARTAFTAALRAERGGAA